MSVNPIAGNATPTLGVLQKRQHDQALTLAKLASGQRINQAADNPAGLIIASQLQAQLGGDEQASDNVSAAAALVQTADGGLDQTQELLGRMRTLALQASSTATTDPAQRAVLDEQFSQLSSALDRIASDTSFAGNRLLDGTYTNRSVQTGDGAGQSVQIGISSDVTGSPAGFDSQGLGLSGANLGSPNAVSDALDRIDSALGAVGQQRGNLGALQSATLDSLGNSLETQRINLAEARSTIMDTDFAQASADLAKNQILNNAGMAMLAQGNLAGGRVLKLLGG